MFDNQMPNVSANTWGGYPSSRSPWSGDFSGNLNDILAPYQRIAQQISSPYATMRPQGWLPQHHPALAGVLDNAFLAMGMTPGPQGPEGVGGGISRTMQGLLGAQQYRRQQIMTQAMLPYQMAMGQLQAADIASQIGERRAMAPYYRARADWYEARMEEANRPKFLPGGTQTDDTGKLWHQKFDPVSGDLSFVDPNTGKTSRELGLQPKFTNAEKQARRATVGGLEGEIMDMRLSSDPAIKAEGERRYAMWKEDQQARAGAIQAGTEPVKDRDRFIQNERTESLSNFDTANKIQNFSDWQMQNMGVLPDAANPQKWGAAYQSYVQTIMGLRQQRISDLDRYQKTEAPNKGVGFGEYMADRDKWDRPGAATVAPAAPPKPGDIVGGYKYLGGDPNDKASWTTP